MISMSCRRALRAESEHNRRLRSSEKRDDVADEACRLELVQRPVGVSTELNRLDAENGCRGAKLILPNSGELLARRNGDAGSFSGVPVRRAKKVDPDAFRAIPRDGPASAKGLVVRVRENDADSARQLSASVTVAQQAQDEHEHVEQVEINRDRRQHVVILRVCPRTQDAPGIEHQ
jgi:hypothetical protein